ncbi:phosphotransferase enzyme family protein [Apiospora sp. TS-2023a]
MGTPLDSIADRNAEDAVTHFIYKFADAKEDIVTFVGNQLGWTETGEFLNYHIGSYNFSISVQKTGTNDRVLIRFPMPGKVFEKWLGQKVKNEVMVLKYLAHHTDIPVPRVYHWGVAEDSPHHVGPFIIEEYMKGESLGDLLKAPTNDKDGRAVLNPDIDDDKLNFVYERIAGFQLQLSRLDFGSIGAIDLVDESGICSVAGAPLTYDMNEVAAFAGFPADRFDMTTGFGRATDYFLERARCLQLNLETHRNVGQEDKNVTWRRYVARRCFEQLIPTYCPEKDNLGPFRLFCDDLRPSNMLADPETMRITAVLDLEFTNALPAQYAYDVPWWLILRNPAALVSDGKKQQLLDLFEPRKEQYIKALERAEAKFPQLVPAAGEPRLSDRVRDSWDSGRFWFNLASRSSFDVDEVYWNCLHEEGRGEAMLDQAILAVKDEFLRKKKDQFDAYYEGEPG